MSDIRVKIDQTKFDVRACGILENNGKILVSTEIDGTQTLSGGAVKIGETTEQAVKREFFEETNLHVEVEKLAAIIENKFKMDEDDYQQVIFVYYLSLSGNQKQELVRKEKISAEWIDKSQITNLKPIVLNDLIQSEKQEIQHIINIEN